MIKLTLPSGNRRVELEIDVVDESEVQRLKAGVKELCEMLDDKSVHRFIEGIFALLDELSSEERETEAWTVAGDVIIGWMLLNGFEFTDGESYLFPEVLESVPAVQEAGMVLKCLELAEDGYDVLLDCGTVIRAIKVPEEIIQSQQGNYIKSMAESRAGVPYICDRTEADLKKLKADGQYVLPRDLLALGFNLHSMAIEVGTFDSSTNSVKVSDTLTRARQVALAMQTNQTSMAN